MKEKSRSKSKGWPCNLKVGTHRQQNPNRSRESQIDLPQARGALHSALQSLKVVVQQAQEPPELDRRHVARRDLVAEKPQRRVQRGLVVGREGEVDVAVASVAAGVVGGGGGGGGGGCCFRVVDGKLKSSSDVERYRGREGETGAEVGVGRCEALVSPVVVDDSGDGRAVDVNLQKAPWLRSHCRIALISRADSSEAVYRSCRLNTGPVGGGSDLPNEDGSTCLVCKAYQSL